MTLAAAFLSLLTSAGPAACSPPRPEPGGDGGGPGRAGQARRPAGGAARGRGGASRRGRGRRRRPTSAASRRPEPVEEELLEGRRRPDIERDRPDAVEQINPGAIRSPPPEAFPADHIPVPDRWRLIQSLGLVRERWWDPYNQNTLKGDRPICTPQDTASSISARSAAACSAR